MMAMELIWDAECREETPLCYWLRFQREHGMGWDRKDGWMGERWIDASRGRGETVHLLPRWMHPYIPT